MFCSKQCQLQSHPMEALPNPHALRSEMSPRTHDGGISSTAAPNQRERKCRWAHGAWHVTRWLVARFVIHSEVEFNRALSAGHRLRCCARAALWSTLDTKSNLLTAHRFECWTLGTWQRGQCMDRAQSSRKVVPESSTRQSLDSLAVAKDIEYTSLLVVWCQEGVPSGSETRRK